METKQLTQSDFAQMLKQAGNETYQTTFEKDTWYEQVTFGETIYQHKLLSLKKMSEELLTRKALESKNSCQPVRLRAQNGGSVLALVFNSKTTVYYHLLGISKSEMAQAKRLVIYFAKSLLPKTSRQLPEILPDAFAA